MDFPIFKLQPQEVAIIYGVLNRYPSAMAKKWELKLTFWGFTIHPSVRVSGLVKDLIGPNPIG